MDKKKDNKIMEKVYTIKEVREQVKAWKKRRSECWIGTYNGIPS